MAATQYVEANLMPEMGDSVSQELSRVHTIVRFSSIDEM